MHNDGLVSRAASLACLFILVAVPTTAQDSVLARRHADAYWYGRFGYGTIGGEFRYGGLTLGFGRRIERDAFGIDVLLCGVQAKLFGTTPELYEIGGIYTHARSRSLLTVKGMYLPRPQSRTTPYLGAGAGWRALTFGRSVGIDERWHGRGLEGELTAGYLLARSPASTRFFVQADLTLPFYRATRYSDTRDVSGDRYASSVLVSLGAGW